MSGTNVQSSPKISRFLALFGSFSLFTAHAVITHRIPKKSGTRYQRPLTCCTALVGATLDMATPLTGAPQFGQTEAVSAIALPQLWQNITVPLVYHLVKDRGGGRWDLNPRRPTPRVVSPTLSRLTTIVHDRFDHGVIE